VLCSHRIAHERVHVPTTADAARCAAPGRVPRNVAVTFTSYTRGKRATRLLIASFDRSARGFGIGGKYHDKDITPACPGEGAHSLVLLAQSAFTHLYLRAYDHRIRACVCVCKGMYDCIRTYVRSCVRAFIRTCARDHQLQSILPFICSTLFLRLRGFRIRSVSGCLHADLHNLCADGEHTQMALATHAVKGVRRRWR
jgi:hypothetical protein